MLKALTLKLMTKNFLTGLETSLEENRQLLNLAMKLKQERQSMNFSPLLKFKNLALVFDKASLRTRMSFTIGMEELGGRVVETNYQNSKAELPKDTARVLSGYVHGIMYRTHEHEKLLEMAAYSKVPVINGLCDTYHPCQALADAMTILEHFKDVRGLTFAYIGDGNNVLHSLLLLLPTLGINVKYACPNGYEPKESILELARDRAINASIIACDSSEVAAQNANILYTDVWTSMGHESEQEKRLKDFEGYQLNEGLVELANSNLAIMHCMPMQRGVEISLNLPDHENSVIFQQAENRLHVQKALMAALMG